MLAFGSLNRSIEWVGGNFSICCIRLVLKNFKWFIEKKNTWGSNGPLCSDSRGAAESVQTTGGSAALPSSLPVKPPYLIHKPVSHTHRKHTPTHLAVSLLRLHWFALFSRLWKISKALKINKQRYSISLLILNTHTQATCKFWCNTLKQCHLYNLILYFKTLEAVWTKLDSRRKKKAYFMGFYVSSAHFFFIMRSLQCSKVKDVTSSHVLLFLIASENHRNNCSADNDAKFHKHDHYWFPFKRRLTELTRVMGPTMGSFGGLSFFFFFFSVSLPLLLESHQAWCQTWSQTATPTTHLKSKPVEVYTN